MALMRVPLLWFRLQYFPILGTVAYANFHVNPVEDKGLQREWISDPKVVNPSRL